MQMLPCEILCRLDTLIRKDSNAPDYFLQLNIFHLDSFKPLCDCIRDPEPALIPILESVRLRTCAWSSTFMQAGEFEGELATLCFSS